MRPVQDIECRGVDEHNATRPQDSPHFIDGLLLALVVQAIQHVKGGRDVGACVRERQPRDGTLNQSPIVGASHSKAGDRSFDANGRAELVEPVEIPAGARSAVDDSFRSSSAKRFLEEQACVASQAPKPEVPLLSERRRFEHPVHR